MALHTVLRYMCDDGMFSSRMRSARSRDSLSILDTDAEVSIQLLRFSSVVSVSSM